jgi:pimeloyl-ACP methyl ester carboxylesterase
MSVDDQVRPLHLRVPESELDDLRERLRRTRLPGAETVTGPDGRLDWSQGPPGGSSARLYWENFPPRGNREVVTVPAAVTIFPADIEKLPRRWVAQRFQNLTYWHVAERGGHFPMIEVPSSFVLELRRALGPMSL